MREQVILSMREQKRLHVISEQNAGRVTGRQAAEFMGVSLRQARRLLAAYRQKGVEAVVHGNRGRAPATRTPEVIRDQVLTLARTTYHDVAKRIVNDRDRSMAFLMEGHAVTTSGDPDEAARVYERSGC